MKDKKMIIITITISVILFFIGLIVGFSMGKNSIKPEPVKEQIDCPEKQEEPKEEKKEEEKEENDYELKKLTSDGEKATASISLNGKQNTLVLENKMKSNETSTFTFGQTELNFLTTYGTATNTKIFPKEVEYKIIVGKDSKEYLYVSYRSTFDQHVLILNDETKIIGKVSSYVDSLKCYALLNKEIGQTEEKPIYRVDDNYIFYYKYSADKDKDNITLDLMKLEIFADNVTEVNTGTRVNGHRAECS